MFVGMYVGVQGYFVKTIVPCESETYKSTFPSIQYNIQEFHDMNPGHICKLFLKKNPFRALNIDAVENVPCW